MTGTRLFKIAIAISVLGLNSFGGEISPSNLLEKVLSKYKSMQTYKAEGVITTDIDMNGMKTTTETPFTILMKKPNLYLISWTQHLPMMPGMSQPGAVWSDGTQPYLYMGTMSMMGPMNAYSKINTDEMALSGATGISGGVANTIPSLFLSVYSVQPNPFSRMSDLEIEKTENVGGEDCYVLSGVSTITKKETFWVSKTT